MYYNGLYIEKDIEKSKHWESVFFESITDIDIKMKTIRAFGYRGFEEFSVDFENDSTLLTGINGSGKSSVLDCCALGISWLHSGISNTVTVGSKLKDSDINNSQHLHKCTIEIEFTLNKTTPFIFIIERAKSNTSSKPKSDYTEVKLLAEIVNHIHNTKNTRLPIFIYYNVDRTEGVNKNSQKFKVRKKNRTTRNNIQTAYQNSLHASRDFTNFTSWLIDTWLAENIEFKDTVQNTSYMETAREIESLNKMLDVVKNSLDKAALDSISQLIASKNVELSEKESSMKDSIRGVISELIFSTIREFMPEINNISVKKDKKGLISLVVKKNELEVDFDQLSQGEKTLLCLVGDITRRIILANGQDNPISNASGIVIIDEVDLHLHPDWQYKIIPNLTKTFKNIQFIFSTHSPQIVSSCPSKSLRIIKDFRVDKMRAGTHGASNSRILPQVFGVDARASDQAPASELVRFLDLVYNKNDYDSDDFKILRSSLYKSFGDNDPDFLEACEYAESSKWERDFEKNQ